MDFKIFYILIVFSIVFIIQCSGQNIMVDPYMLYAPVPSVPTQSKPLLTKAPNEIVCIPNQQYTLAHPVYCDRFYSCDNGTPVMYQCEDGYTYHEEKKECKLFHLVKCGQRHKMQIPQGSGLCQRLNGLYADRKNGCEKYVNCGNGTAYPTSCPGGLVFDDNHKYCKRPSDEDLQLCQKPPLVLQCKDDSNVKGGYSESICSTFKCPITDYYSYGDHARYPNPIDCKTFIICLRDGTAKVQGCPGDMIFSNIQYVCVNSTQKNECFNNVH